MEHCPCELCYSVFSSDRALMHHIRARHNLPSSSPDAVMKRISRENAAKAWNVTRTSAVRSPPPTIDGIPQYRALRQRHSLTPGQLESLRRWIIVAVQSEWCPRLDIAPSILLDNIRMLIDRNLAAPPRLQRRVEADDIP